MGYLPLRSCYEYILLPVNQYLDLGGEEKGKCLALWILGTYCYQLFSSYPYIHLTGDAGSGKTKTLQLASALAFNGRFFSSGTSTAATVRTVDNDCATCCIDEVEAIAQARDEVSRSVVTMLNNGYKQGGGDYKCEKLGQAEQWVPIFFNYYSPKILAGIKGLESSLATRCIPILMLRTQNKKIGNRELKPDSDDFAVVRSMIYPTMLQSFATIKEQAKSISSDVLTNREWELWKPIIVLASLVDKSGGLSNEMEKLALQLRKTKKESETVTSKLLEALLHITEVQGEETSFYDTASLAQELHNYDEDSFGWLADEFNKYKRGKFIGAELRKAGVVEGRAEGRSIEGAKKKGYMISREKVLSLIPAYHSSMVTDTKDSAS